MKCQSCQKEIHPNKVGLCEECYIISLSKVADSKDSNIVNVMVNNGIAECLLQQPRKSNQATLTDEEFAEISQKVWDKLEKKRKNSSENLN